MWTIDYEEINLVNRHRGAMPVILTCPHGGGDQLRSQRRAVP